MNNVQPGQHANEIIKRLERNINGLRRPYDVFADFLDIAERCLIDQPAHLERACAGFPTVECAETTAVWERLHRYYPKNDDKAWSNFAEAFALLMDSASGEAKSAASWDVIGESFMAFGAPSQWHGQFFTPWSISVLMAKLQYDEELLIERLDAAKKKAQAAGDWAGDSAEMTGDFLLAVAPHFEPVTVYDPACGSGVMLLAFASCAPAWANRFAMVRYRGQDIDASCVKMASINLMLHGLNGYALRCERARMLGQMAAAFTPDVVRQFEFPVQRPLFSLAAD